MNCDLWIPCVNDVHSNIHALTGGFGSSGVTGVMLQAETTGLDPIFHVHHSQVRAGARTEPNYTIQVGGVAAYSYTLPATDRLALRHLPGLQAAGCAHQR